MKSRIQIAKEILSIKSPNGLPFFSTDWAMSEVLGITDKNEIRRIKINKLLKND